MRVGKANAYQCACAYQLIRPQYRQMRTKFLYGSKTHVRFRLFVQQNGRYCQDLRDSVCRTHDKDIFVCHLERYRCELSDHFHNADIMGVESSWGQSFLVKRHREGYYIIRNYATTLTRAARRRSSLVPALWLG